MVYCRARLWILLQHRLSVGRLPHPYAFSARRNEERTSHAILVINVSAVFYQLRKYVDLSGDRSMKKRSSKLAVENIYGTVFNQPNGFRCCRVSDCLPYFVGE
jgi:hypothetical protein